MGSFLVLLNNGFNCLRKWKFKLINEEIEKIVKFVRTLITNIAWIETVSWAVALLMKWYEKFYDCVIANKKYLVKKKDNNPMFSRQYNIFLIELAKNILFSFVLINFNIMAGLDIICVLYGQKVEPINIKSLVIEIIIIAIYILLIVMLNKVYFHNDKSIPCGIILGYGLLCGGLLDFFFAFGLWKTNFYPWCCLGVTVVEIVLNDLLLRKLSLYREYRLAKENIFFGLNVIMTCIYVTIYVAVIQFGDIDKHFDVMYVCITVQIIIIVCEVIMNDINECAPYEKEIWMKNGNKKLTNSGIEERKIGKITWREDGRKVEVDIKHITKISYIAHYSHKGMKERKIVLADGNEVKGYVFKSFLSWYGICWIEGDAVKVELYPADNVVRCEDNIN